VEHGLFFGKLEARSAFINQDGRRWAKLYSLCKENSNISNTEHGIIFNTTSSLREKRGGKMKLISVKLPEALIEGMDELVRKGAYPSRSAILRTAVRDLLKKELWNQ